MFAVGNILLGLKVLGSRLTLLLCSIKPLMFTAWQQTSSVCLVSSAAMLCPIYLFILFIFREDQVNFRGFMRTLAHFRPIEDNEKNKNASASEPLNSRTNKLLCEFCSLRHLLAFQQIHWVSSSYHNLFVFVFFNSSRFPPVWPGQGRQNLPGRTAAGEKQVEKTQFTRW